MGKRILSQSKEKEKYIFFITQGRILEKKKTNNLKTHFIVIKHIVKKYKQDLYRYRTTSI